MPSESPFSHKPSPFHLEGVLLSIDLPFAKKKIDHVDGQDTIIVIPAFCNIVSNNYLAKRIASKIQRAVLGILFIFALDSESRLDIDFFAAQSSDEIYLFFYP